MQPSPVHARAQGHGQGGEAEAESASRYVLERPMTPYMDVEGDGLRLAVGDWRLLICSWRAGLTITDAPKKNAKGKREAK